jgi:hypothetical protein
MGLEMQVRTPNLVPGHHIASRTDRGWAEPGVATDFQFDCTIDGRPVKIISIVDEHTREARPAMRSSCSLLSVINCEAEFDPAALPMSWTTDRCLIDQRRRCQSCLRLAGRVVSPASAAPVRRPGSLEIGNDSGSVTVLLSMINS